MPKFESHIFVCCNRRATKNPRGSCDPSGCEKLRNCFKAEITRRGLKPRVRANKAGSLDQCELGPVVFIYPQEIWHGGVDEQDVPRIIQDTDIDRKILEDLLIADEKLNVRK